jgi:hypothetical protein
MTKSRTRTVTLLDLVRTVQDFARSDREVVAVVTHLFRSGRIGMPAGWIPEDAPARARPQ